MNDTMVTLVGNAATAVEHRQTTAGVSVARFRLAATSRRWDRAQERWTDGGTSFYTVRSWRALADNVAASVAVGEPLVVQGRLRLREGEQPPDRGGQRWFSAEVDAVAIGHDLARGTAAFRRVVRPPRTDADHGPAPSSAPHLLPSSRQEPPGQQEPGEGMLSADRTPPGAAGSRTEPTESTEPTEPTESAESAEGERPVAGEDPAQADAQTPAEKPALATEPATRPAPATRPVPATRPALAKQPAGRQSPTKRRPPTARQSPAKRRAAEAISPPSEPLEGAVPPASTLTLSPEKVAVYRKVPGICR
ncbi:single-strand DNA-binding protein [Streptomyces sp. KS_16]|nr:single-strand DNA-binding protein [Streptomyces sp. 2321.6]SDR49573.1 single-strand DNA-binding protein [Streptomyces sp. KS_16]SEC58524.1 single-strand DNA-binding protein [Streptomyces sp. 2133.1]SNC68436.1 single-strand DNA-binding protein [Streptomyces sp. 2114.4]